MIKQDFMDVRRNAGKQKAGKKEGFGLRKSFLRTL